MKSAHPHIKLTRGLSQFYVYVQSNEFLSSYLECLVEGLEGTSMEPCRVLLQRDLGSEGCALPGLRWSRGKCAWKTPSCWLWSAGMIEHIRWKSGFSDWSGVSSLSKCPQTVRCSWLSHLLAPTLLAMPAFSCLPNVFGCCCCVRMRDCSFACLSVRLPHRVSMLLFMLVLQQQQRRHHDNHSWQRDMTS